MCFSSRSYFKSENESLQAFCIYGKKTLNVGIYSGSDGVIPRALHSMITSSRPSNSEFFLYKPPCKSSDPPTVDLLVVSRRSMFSFLSGDTFRDLL